MKLDRYNKFFAALTAGLIGWIPISFADGKIQGNDWADLALVALTAVAVLFAPKNADDSNLGT